MCFPTCLSTIAGVPNGFRSSLVNTVSEALNGSDWIIL